MKMQVSYGLSENNRMNNESSHLIQTSQSNEEIEKKKENKFQNLLVKSGTKRASTNSNHNMEDIESSSYNTYKEQSLFAKKSIIDEKYSNEYETPSWSEVMKKITPYLYPDDLKHTAYVITALVLIFVGKVVNVLPPLAIKHAVDIISNTTKPYNVINTNEKDYSNGNTVTSSLTALDKQKARSIVFAILVYYGLKLLSLFLSTIQNITQRTVSLDAERRFSVTVFAHLQRLSLSYHLEKHIGEITQIMSRGSDSVSTLINAFLFSLVPTLFETFVVTLVFAKLGTPMISFTTLITVIIYFAFSYMVTKTRIRFRRDVNQASDALGMQETETLVNFETVCMFGRTDTEIKKYTKLRQNYKNVRETLMHVFQGLQGILSFIRLSGTSLGLILAGWQVVYTDPPLSPGSFVVVQIYIDQLFQPLTNLASTYRNLIQAFTDLEKVVMMLNRVPEIQDSPNSYVWNKNQIIAKQQDSCIKANSSGEIIFQNVSFAYKIKSRKRAFGSSALAPINNVYQQKGGRWRGHGGRSKFQNYTMQFNSYNNYGNDNNKTNERNQDAIVQNGISNISFCIPSGKTAALVGRSGSGKTTIIRLILRMYDPDEGIVSIDGHNVKELTQNSLRENIGIVAQETILFNASLRDNIIYGKQNATDDEIWDAVQLASLTEFVQKLPDKLDTIVGERGMKLSGGERQRVGIARCVIKNPKLILLDEATSALDSGTEKVIQKNLSNMCKSTTTLMIAHRLSTARYADEIIVLEEGQICQRGTHDELLSQTDARYAKMWADQEQPDSKDIKSELIY